MSFFRLFAGIVFNEGLLLCSVVVLGLLTIDGEAAVITSAVHRPFVQRVELQAEGNEAINAAKSAMQDLGSLVSIGLFNDGKKPVSLQELEWGGKSSTEHAQDLQLIWHRLEPQPVAPGGEAELSLCLRTRLQDDTDFRLVLSDGTHVVAHVAAAAPSSRFEGICFAEGLRRIWLYVSTAAGVRGEDLKLWRNGSDAAGTIRWLRASPLPGLHVGVLELEEPLPRGSVQTFRLEGSGQPIATSLRAFARPSVFGTYGRADFERQAFNGLTGYNSFGTIGRDGLDAAADLGIRCAIMSGGNPPDASLGHEGLYAYVLTDEPDCKDYGVKDRPMGKRIGAHAPQMLTYAQRCHSADPRTPTMLTLNLTFTPANYFIYGHVADIANPDCYPITVGWSVRVVRNYLQTVRQATAPRPFCYTYQGCWEEYAKKQDTSYIGGDTLRQKGWESFRDPDRIRGLGRPPDPAEVEIMMLYGMGCGAKGLFSYIDASELCGTLMFHGSEDLPELWHQIGQTSRLLNRVSPLIDIAHPAKLASSDADSLWVSTLLAGDRGVLVVAVNEAFTSDKDAFRLTPLPRAGFSLPALPWMQDWHVVRVTDGGWQDVQQSTSPETVVWQDSIEAGAVYLATSRQVLDELAQRDASTHRARAAAIVQRRRARLREERNRRMLIRDLARGPVETRLVGDPVNGYGVTDRTLWDPQQEKYNAVDFWERKGTKTLGVTWKTAVSQDMARNPLRFIWQGRLYGGTTAFTVTDEVGNSIIEKTLQDVRGVAVREQELVFDKPGQYTITISVAPADPREHGGRIARVAYLVP